MCKDILALVKLGERVYAGSNKASCAGHFYNADTAGADFVDFLEPAKRRDSDAIIATSFKNGSTFFN